MAYGIWKIHHAIQSQEARRDFVLLGQIAGERGRADLVEKHACVPSLESCGWRKIDKQSGKIRAELGLELNDFLEIKRQRTGSA